MNFTIFVASGTLYLCIHLYSLIIISSLLMYIIDVHFRRKPHSNQYYMSLVALKKPNKTTHLNLNFNLIANPSRTFGRGWSHIETLTPILKYIFEILRRDIKFPYALYFITLTKYFYVWTALYS